MFTTFRRFAMAVHGGCSVTATKAHSRTLRWLGRGNSLGYGDKNFGMVIEDYCFNEGS